MRRSARYTATILGIISLNYYGWHALEKNSEAPAAKPVIFGLIGAPYSMDPMEYNAFVHHVTVRPVFASLVSQYKSGTILGQIAESWSNSDDLSTWTFYLRPDLRFANGDSITPEIVRLALTRVAYLQHNAKSASGLTEHLKGIEKITSASDRFEGIETSDNKIILRFTQPQEKLLEAISFGLYSIVHPSDFDPITGRWKNPKTAIASAAYEIKEWSDQELILNKRSNILDLMARHDSPQTVKFVWSAEHLKNADIVMGPSLDSEQHQSDEYFGSGAMTTSIYYVHLVSWNDPHSPLSHLGLRRYLRKFFYDDLALIDGQIERSFLPAGVTHEVQTHKSTPDQPPVDLKSLNLKISAPRAHSIFAEKLSQALKSGLRKAGMATQIVDRPSPKGIIAALDPTPQDRKLDILPLYTNILVEDPVADVKFMIASKEGIKLPDPTGRLKLEAAKQRPDFAKINDVLWDDAIIWPVTHFSSGLWAKKGLFDFSQINLSLPPTDISWIGVVK